MFRLQRLEITGFKSFADYTDLMFTGEGITGVVGPNGCGKSNVADAIAWVLGEQRVKHLRGAEMKDVIFQGSRNRQPSGMAEVVLHLVRDEATDEEPDIDDIDSTLEEIDERSESVEVKFLPEAAATETAADEAAVVQATPDVASDAGEAVGEVAAQENETAPATDDAAGVQTPEALTAKVQQHHKRHWRPRRLALGFAPGETVTVTRRLYRDGESEYLLNGRTCRLRDIQDLFSGTGLAGAHYAIIEQGRIGQILSAKPMDRRSLIEEAAGITKFRVRQRAAEARLEGARSNLRRVSDIVSEIERQVGSLRRQAAKARRYRALREELRELLRHVYAADERALTISLEELRAHLAASAEEVSALAAKLEEHEDEARRATGEAREREEELAAARGAVADAALRRDRRERERAYQVEQATSLERRVSDITRQMEMVRERLATVEAERETLRAGDAQLRVEAETTARDLQEAEAVYARRVAEVSDAETRIEAARAELLTHTAVAERLSEINRQLEATLERLAAQAEGLEREGERARAAHAEFTAQAETLSEEIKDARARLDVLNVERSAASEGVAAARSLVSATLTEYARMREEAARVRNRLDTLAELDEKRALYSQAVQRIFSAEHADEAEIDPAKDFHTIGTLADMLQVAPQWEHAVESIFGSYLQTVIVPTPDDAFRAAAWLEANNAGRATFLVAGLHGASAETENDYLSRGTLADERLTGLQRLGDLLGAPREIAAVLARTLPREMAARLSDDLEGAMSLSFATGDMCVTPRGEWVAGGQLLGAGNSHAVEEGTGLLAFKREMRELESRAADLASEVVSAEDSVSAARARLVELEDALVLVAEQIGREEREQVARELNHAQLAQEIERAARHLRVVADDTARLAEERRELEARRTLGMAEAEAAEAARLAATQSVAEAAELLAAERRAAEVEGEQLNRQRMASAAAAERRRATAAELRRMEAENADLEARLERHAAEIEEMQTRLEELRRAMAEMDETSGSVESERATREAEVADAAERLAEARARADALSDELTELNHRAAAARDARATLEVNRAETVARLNYLHEACMAELAQPLEEIVTAYEPDVEFDLEAGRARVEELRARVESFGAVNMMALEELAESEERLSFLTTQRQDIIDGIGSTEEALREIKRRSRERFREAFEEINRNFGQLFLELFGGGRGEMSMIDADDVLESGIDIVAQPPGKRLQNVLLLSGGEKAMAALSLVLAIFRYRPSPFCLLDEVDAPLDEANIGRFTAKIAEMATNTQFIVITHNKRTMEIARALYGVTMEEAGVSKLVSVRFE
ncbi:MAG TPA: chromosome segregation protein SMC [Pyrinomonadaceae bacterium]|jgi:chromosome segregation protein|nr:chromosome segregation protein SMC [Pyrinomonadaceae bacterium]